MKASKKTKPVNNPAAEEVQYSTGSNSVELLKDEYNLPSYDALAQILPDYLVTGAKTELQNASHQEQDRPADRTEANKHNINRTYKKHNPHKRAPLPEFEDDPHVAKITDLQTKEVENYRSAMSRMAEDIILLRTRIVALEAENSQLRSDLSLRQDLGRDLLDDTDIDVMTKDEISDRIASLKFKLASETSKAASQKDRIQKLQNELIKKNDNETELLKLQRIHQQKEQLHQSHMKKVETLEATVMQQEKIIEKMEKALDSKLREKSRQSGDKSFMLKKHRGDDRRKEEIESALAAENIHLREELDRIRRQPPTVIIQQSAQVKGIRKKKEAPPLKERLSLLNRLEKAEARVQILEGQLEENSKLWGRQKQEMLTKLNEHRHGFVHTTILRNSSVVS
ncbi:coiled-coil domain-containing protein 33 [Channa argus]|uniref:coiled-coil domain-containing protein 33 n=1 Tax=Channa argus TaxID=215402 RepID=UPI0035205F7B